MCTQGRGLSTGMATAMGVCGCNSAHPGALSCKPINTVFGSAWILWNSG